MLFVFSRWVVTVLHRGLPYLPVRQDQGWLRYARNSATVCYGDPVGEARGVQELLGQRRHALSGQA